MPPPHPPLTTYWQQWPCFLEQLTLKSKQGLDHNTAWASIKPCSWYHRWHIASEKRVLIGPTKWCTNTCPELFHRWLGLLVSVPVAWLQNRSLASLSSSLQNLAQGFTSIRKRKECMACRCKGTLVDGVNNWDAICWVPCDSCGSYIYK